MTMTVYNPFVKEYKFSDVNYVDTNTVKGSDGENMFAVTVYIGKGRQSVNLASYSPDQAKELERLMRAMFSYTGEESEKDKDDKAQSKAEEAVINAVPIDRSTKPKEKARTQGKAKTAEKKKTSEPIEKTESAEPIEKTDENSSEPTNIASLKRSTVFAYKVPKLIDKSEKKSKKTSQIMEKRSASRLQGSIEESRLIKKNPTETPTESDNVSSASVTLTEAANAKKEQSTADTLTETANAVKEQSAADTLTEAVNAENEQKTLDPIVDTAREIDEPVLIKRQKAIAPDNNSNKVPDTSMPETNQGVEVKIDESGEAEPEVHEDAPIAETVEISNEDQQKEN
jgi:hypothetical protein